MASRTKIAYCSAFLIGAGVFLCASRWTEAQDCLEGSCYPSAGDLLIGRENALTATSTCGLIQPQRYCLGGTRDEEQKCFRCDSRQSYVAGLSENSHRVENIVQKTMPEGGQRRATWWQSENGVQNVSITLSLEAVFHVTHAIITFKTVRPAAMFIERSRDFGETWDVYRYFAFSCAESFPGIPTGLPENITEVFCEEKYSQPSPSTGGEVVFRVLPSNIEIKDPSSTEVQDLLSVTNLRFNFTKLHSLGEYVLQGPAIAEKYYYALSEMVVRGACSCNGHAERCVPLTGISEGQMNKNMVHGQCECMHYTTGPNCDQCQDFYHDIPWRPAVGRTVNACKRCQCNAHSDECHFDPAIFTAGSGVSGGVCEACKDYTMGRNCEMCQMNFYRDPTYHASVPCVPDKTINPSEESEDQD